MPRPLPDRARAPRSLPVSVNAPRSLGDISLGVSSSISRLCVYSVAFPEAIVSPPRVAVVLLVLFVAVVAAGNVVLKVTSESGFILNWIMPS